MGGNNLKFFPVPNAIQSVSAPITFTSETARTMMSESAARIMMLEWPWLTQSAAGRNIIVSASS